VVQKDAAPLQSSSVETLRALPTKRSVPARSSSTMRTVNEPLVPMLVPVTLREVEPHARPHEEAGANQW